MIEKVSIFLACLAVAKSNTIETHLTSEASGSSINSPIVNALNYRTNAEPAPIYEQDASAKETIDVDKNRFSFATTYPDSVSSQHAYKPAYDSSKSPTIRPKSGPVTYTTNTHNIPFELEERPFTAPDISKSSELTYNSQIYSHIQNEAIKTSVGYEEAPAVSHMSFTGFGTTYTW